MGVDVRVRLFNQKVYRETILPAYEEFARSGDVNPLVGLLDTAATERATANDGNPWLWSEDVYAEAAGILNGTVYYSSEGITAGAKTSPEDLKLFVRNNAGPDLVTFFCVDRLRGVDPDQSMGRGQLVPYLYGRSAWIQDVFTFAKPITGGTLEIPMGESTEVFSKTETATFFEEVKKAGRPGGDATLSQEYDKLLDLLRAALDNPDLVLVRTIV